MRYNRNLNASSQLSPTQIDRAELAADSEDLNQQLVFIESKKRRMAGTSSPNSEWTSVGPLSLGHGHHLGLNLPYTSSGSPTSTSRGPQNPTTSKISTPRPKNLTLAGFGNWTRHGL